MAALQTHPIDRSLLIPLGLAVCLGRLLGFGIAWRAAAGSCIRGLILLAPMGTIHHFPCLPAPSIPRLLSAAHPLAGLYRLTCPGAYPFRALTGLRVALLGYGGSRAEGGQQSKNTECTNELLH